MPLSPDSRQRWTALYVVCVGVLMIVLDTTIVNVALPSIQVDLGFTETSLVWVINAYLLTFGGFLLLGGRLGDLYGHRKLFLAGLGLFTTASLVCGLAQNAEILVAARAVQGVGGAVVDAISLSLIVSLFTEPAERAEAMGFYGFVCAAGGCVGVLLGGLLTSISWHWIFLVNIPIGIGVYIVCLRLLPDDAGTLGDARLDYGGAVTITLALMCAVYAIVNGNEAGWLSRRTLGLLAGSGALLAAFVAIELRVAHPLIPLQLFRLPNLRTASIAGVLWAGGMFSWFFISALYLQRVLNYNPLQVGLAFLPSNILMAASSLGFSAWLVARYGMRLPWAAGLLMAGVGLVLFARAPVDGSFWIDVFPGMALLGLGGGIAFNPILLAAMSEVSEKDSGLASGVVNTAFMMGAALGLAALASLAAARTAHLESAGAAAAEALNGGYQWAAFGGAIMVLVAAVLGFRLRRVEQPAEAVAA